MNLDNSFKSIMKLHKEIFRIINIENSKKLLTANIKIIQFNQCEHIGIHKLTVTLIFTH